MEIVVAGPRPQWKMTSGGLRYFVVDVWANKQTHEQTHKQTNTHTHTHKYTQSMGIPPARFCPLLVISCT